MVRTGDASPATLHMLTSPRPGQADPSCGCPTVTSRPTLPSQGEGLSWTQPRRTGPAPPQQGPGFCSRFGGKAPGDQTFTGWELLSSLQTLKYHVKKMFSALQLHLNIAPKRNNSNTPERKDTSVHPPQPSHYWNLSKPTGAEIGAPSEHTAQKQGQGRWEMTRRPPATCHRGRTHSGTCASLKKPTRPPLGPFSSLDGPQSPVTQTYLLVS